jgi:hypothetical protein
VLGVNTAQRQFASGTIRGGQVKREHWLIDRLGIHQQLKDRGQVVHGNGLPRHAQDAVELSNAKRRAKAGYVRDFRECRQLNTDTRRNAYGTVHKPTQITGVLGPVDMRRLRTTYRHVQTRNADRVLGQKA